MSFKRKRGLFFTYEGGGLINALDEKFEYFSEFRKFRESTIWIIQH